MIQQFLGLREVHNYIADAEVHLVKKLGVPLCIPNCGMCCEHDCITIYSIEASLVLSYAMGDGKLKIIEMCREWLLEPHRGVETYTGVPYGVVSGQLKHEWSLLSQSKCPMLTQDKQCFIHDMRPIVCRMYGVTRCAGPNCPRPVGKGESFNSRGYMGGDAADFLEDELNKYFGKMRVEHPDYTKIGFLPTMIFRQAREKEFRELIAERKIASAKLVGTDTTTQILFEKYALAAENILSG